MANAKHVERRLTRLKAKYSQAGGSPTQLRRKAEVKVKRAKQAADIEKVVADNKAAVIARLGVIESNLKAQAEEKVIVEIRTGPATDALIDALVATTAEAEASAI
jgi:hypothetical protein